MWRTIGRLGVHQTRSPSTESRTTYISRIRSYNTATDTPGDVITTCNEGDTIWIEADGSNLTIPGGPNSYLQLGGVGITNQDLLSFGPTSLDPIPWPQYINEPYGGAPIRVISDNLTEGNEILIWNWYVNSATVASASVTIVDTSFDIGQYSFNGTPTNWAKTNATSSTYGSYTYPSGTSESLHTLTGSQYLLSNDVGNNVTLNINLWFYPTANNLVIMSELGQPVENSDWHYSMLDIDDTNHLRGRLWEFVDGVTSTGTVTLNAWNHTYLYYNTSTGYVGMSLNNETAVTINTGTRHLADLGHTYFGIGLIDDQNVSSNARYQGKFSDLSIETTLTGSTYSTTLSKYSPPGIVTNGLVLHYDFSNPVCYSGTGTNITDLSTSTNNGTVVNDYNHISFVSNGSASYFNWDSNVGGSGGNQFNGSIQTTVANVYQDFTIVFEPDFSMTGMGGLFSIPNDKSLRVYNNSWTFPNPGNSDDWASSPTTYYMNGQVSNQAEPSQWNIIGGTTTNGSFSSASQLYFGTSGYENRHMQGKIALVLMYNRTLTESEQLQNYNALKSRFSIY